MPEVNLTKLHRVIIIHILPSTSGSPMLYLSLNNIKMEQRNRYGSIKGREFLDELGSYQLLKTDCAPWSQPASQSVGQSVG
jgi:hypothetical protein